MSLKKLQIDGFINREDQSFNNIKEDNYLYQMEVASDTLFNIQQEMLKLNNFCAHSLNFSKDKSLKAKENYLSYSSGRKKANLYNSPSLDDKIDENSAEYGHFLEDLENDSDQWEDTFTFIAPAMTLVLFHIFVEKSLLDLCKESTPHVDLKPKQKKYENIIVTYINFLQVDCKINFQLDENIINLLQKCRIIRNKFAHGNWTEIKEIVSKIDLVDVFYAFTKMLRSFENEIANTD